MNDVKTDRVGLQPLFRADWQNAAFIHFTIRPDLLQPFVPLKLDLRENTAFVSLVAFTQRDLRELGRQRCKNGSFPLDLRTSQSDD